MSKPLILLTLGDPGGIGPEVIARSFQKPSAFSKVRVVVAGVPSVFEVLKKKCGLRLNPGLGFLDVSAEALRILKNTDRKAVLRPDIGKVSVRNAAMAYAALKVAAREAVHGNVQAIVTAPVHKTAMRLIDPRFHGHTEFLAHAAGRKEFAMMFVSKRLKVTLATIHVPIQKVSALITRGLVLEKIRLTDEFLKKRFRIKRPRIAVCALNPHGRETGTEDESRIRPAVREAVRRGIHAVGPLSADQLFFDAYEGRFDAVVSMYHDQGLAPFKMIAFRDGVNVTLGLPFVRTSPDHGTAFDIAYQGKADPASFQSAFDLAEELVLKNKPVSC